MVNHTKYWFLEDFNLMKKMGKKNLMRMCELLEMVAIKKGEELNYNREDSRVIYFLKKGTVKIVSATTSHTKGLIKEGNIFGEQALYNNDETEDKAIVLESGVICFIEVNQMKELMEQQSSFKNELLKLSGFRIKRLERRLENLLYKDSNTRIEEYISDYVLEFGVEKDGYKETKNFLSHSDIAYLTNTSRQTVNNVMSSLRKKGIIDYNSKMIKLIKN